MKRILRILSAVFALLLPVFVPAARAEAADTALRFDGDGSFTIMLLSDVQDTQYPPAFLLRSIEGALNNYEVDLVVLLGDQLEGQSPLLRLGDAERNVEKALSYVLSPIQSAGIPFAFLFGNHDYDAPVSTARQAEIYRSYASCLTPELSGQEAYCLPVYPADGDKAALLLYFFDTGPDVSSGYGAVSAEQVDWYTQTSRAYYEASNSQTIPAVAFQHVPVAEIYELFDEAPAGSEGALKSGESSYLPSEERIFIGEAREAPCTSLENYGLFDAFIEQGDVFLAVSGHDHVNSFIGSVRGVDLGAAPGSSYTSYGSAEMRGVRLLRFNVDDVKSYDTIHVKYAEYIQTGGLAAVRYYFSTTTAIPNAVKTLVLFLLLLAVIVLIVCLLVRSRRRPKPPRDADGESGFDDAPAAGSEQDAAVSPDTKS